jgi:hypothetical protein
VTPATSAELLVAIRTGARTEPTDGWRNWPHLDPEELAASPPDDAARIATWVNLYSAATQLLVEAHPGRFARRTRYFRQRAAALIVSRIGQGAPVLTRQHQDAPF